MILQIPAWQNAAPEASVSLWGPVLLSASRVSVPWRIQRWHTSLQNPVSAPRTPPAWTPVRSIAFTPKRTKTASPRRPVVHRSGRVHRLRRVRPGLPGLGHLCAGRPAGEMGSLYREERGALRPLSCREVIGAVADCQNARPARRDARLHLRPAGTLEPLESLLPKTTEQRCPSRPRLLLDRTPSAIGRCT
jgi:hypothetical protein